MATTDATQPTNGPASLLSRAPHFLFLAAVVALPFMQPFSIRLLGSAVQPADAIFALAGLAWLGALVGGAVTLRRGRYYLLLGLFLGVVCLTALVAPSRSLARLVIEIYLFGLSILAYNLVRSLDDLRHMWIAWTATAAFTAAAILVSMVLFYAAGLKDPSVNLVLWSYGSLPVGNYPRARGFFLNGNMTGSYLAVSACLAVGLAALSERWRRSVLAAAGGIALASLFTLSPALGGLAIAIGLFAWLFEKHARTGLFLKALLPLAVLAALALLFFTAVYPTRVAEGVTFEASPRWLTWVSSSQTFLAHPLFGSGLGAPLASVYYMPPSGGRQHLTDPHNTWLSVAGQTGVIGLLAFLALLVWLARGLRGMALAGGSVSAARAALAGGFIVVVYQAFSISLEDMRHVWLLFGLIVGIAESPHCRRASTVFEE